MRSHQAGRTSDAAARYDEVLRDEPRNFAAWHLSGVLHAQLGNYDDAHSRLNSALEIDPKSATARSDLGLVLAGAGKMNEAIHCYRHALEIDPDHAQSLDRLGHALVGIGEFDQAIDCFRRLTSVNPNHTGAYIELGGLLRRAKKIGEAIACYARALRLKPDDARTHCELGAVFADLARYDEAIACFGRALRLAPALGPAHAGIGHALSELGKPIAAIAYFRRALEIDQSAARTHHLLGMVLEKLGRNEDAIEAYRNTLRLRPDWAGTRANLGNVLMARKQYADAIESFQRALAIDPQLDYALGQLTYLKRQLCDWASLNDLERQLLSCIRGKSTKIVPFTIVAGPSTPEDQLCAARSFLSEMKFDAFPPLWQGQRWNHEKIRIGYISADFHVHATAHLMAELFEIHDRSKFEIFAFSFGPDQQSETRVRLVKAFDRFFDIRLQGDADASRLILQNEIDIAVDLKGYTKDSRVSILARRPAPIQANYLGYPATMGARFMDYIIADPITVPFEEQSFFTEKIVHLPDCYQVNDRRRRIAPRTPSRAGCGLPERGFVFCCFNNNSKITPVFFDIWMRLLNSAPGSILWLVRDNPWAEENLRMEAQSRGVPAKRLVFAPRATLEDHLARHRVADLFLDTLPYNAHTTASDALWAGLPVLTCAGTTFAGRVAGSLLQAIGLPELIARNLEEYEALALKLATDPMLLSGVRAKLDRNRSTRALFDTNRFRRNLEAAYTEMWRIWQRGEAPRSFAVNAEENPAIY